MQVSEKSISVRSRKKIWLAVPGLIFYIIGDYLLGFNSIGTSSDPDALYGLMWNVVPDWRYALSGIFAFAGVPLFAIAAVELMQVLETDYHLRDGMAYKTFRVGLWAGIMYFTLVHIGMCMMAVVFNAGMSATGDQNTSIQMAVRVAESAAIPIFGSFAVVDFCTSIGWIIMVLKGQIPVKRIAVICNPIIMALIGQLVGLIPLPFSGIDSGFESLGWLTMFAVCAARLLKGKTD